MTPCPAGGDRGIVRPVKRRLSTILLPLAVASLGAGCATFTDADVAVRVNDTDYSHEQLDDIADFYTIAIGGVPQAADANQLRDAATAWVQTRAVVDYLDGQNIDVPAEAVTEAEATIDDIVARVDADDARFPDFDGLTDEARSFFVDLVSYSTTLNELDPGGAFLQQAVGESDVYVDPQIGYLDDASGFIVPLG